MGLCSVAAGSALSLLTVFALALEGRARECSVLVTVITATGLSGIKGLSAGNLRERRLSWLILAFVERIELSGHDSTSSEPEYTPF